MMVDADKAKKKLAAMVQNHWNDASFLTNQKDQAFRSAEAIRSADLSDCILDWLDTQEFYEVCQRYRHSKDYASAQPSTVQAFEDLKTYIRNHAV